MAKKKDAYEEFAGEFKNEADFEEELEAEDLDPKRVQERHFEEEETPAIEDREIIAVKKKRK
ncbi:hypothetical protein FJZ17_03440 [Candidatus Pacearchaeota archaeon]|nr:hypothetical protein [Candidatus Pacearchaeota archaeon]